MISLVRDLLARRQAPGAVVDAERHSGLGAPLRSLGLIPLTQLTQDPPDSQPGPTVRASMTSIALALAMASTVESSVQLLLFVLTAPLLGRLGTLSTSNQ
jgi:hypothetical protein